MNEKNKKTKKIKKIKKSITISKGALEAIAKTEEKTSRFIEGAVMEKINNIASTKKLALANFKGGVGKSTITHNIVHILANAGKKVLAIDVDAQGNLSSAFGHYDIEKPSLLELLIKEKKVEEVIISVADNIDLIPANVSLIKFMRMGIQGKGLALKNIFKKIDMSSYDFVIFDCSTAYDELNTSVFSIAESVYVPLAPGKFPLEGISILKETLSDAVDMYEVDTQIRGVFLNLYKNNNVAKYSYNQMIEEFKDVAFKTKVRDLVDVSKSQFMEQSVLEAGGSAKKDFVDLVNEILEREGVEPIEI